MAIIKNKVTFIGAVALMSDVDMGIQDLVFPKARPRTTSLIEYNYATVENASAAYHSFAETSQTVQKDGFSIVRLGPLNFNESISKEKIQADAQMFGQTVYGDGQLNPEVESALHGVAKLQQRALIGTKKAIYEALTLHSITGGYKGQDGVEDIVFNVPAGNKKTLTNSGSEVYWTDTTNAKPLDNLYAAYVAMKIKPSMVVMSSNTYGNFYDNVQILTADNSTSGKKKNYTLNENVNPDDKFFRAGRVQHKDMILDVYVERDTYKVGSTDTLYLPDAYVALTSRASGTTEFAGIPVAEKGGEGVRNIASEVNVDEVITLDPPQHKVVHRTAPLPLLKNGEAFYSLKVTA